MALFSIIGMPIASATFPKLTRNKNDLKKQKSTVKDALKWILLATIPATFIGFIWAEFWLSFLFNLDGEILRMGTIILRWVILSLPFAAIIPLFSRVFLANDDVVTPMKISIFSIFIATVTAAILSLKILPPEIAVMGLAIGTFIANSLSATLFGYFIWKQKQISRNF
jgi:peptidoglycan biosynthesis protein MviN/MurJ (putative lipid II flippase)